MYVSAFVSLPNHYDRQNNKYYIYEACLSVA